MERANKKNKKIEQVDSAECFEQLSKIPNSFLIDVRTKPEWEFNGVPDLSSINKKVIFISWLIYPEMEINSHFEKELSKLNIIKNYKLYFICRSGNRSFEAANFLSTINYNYCFNLTDGFEGDKNKMSQRSTINGWKYNKLPWKQ
tara:strand:- start:1004 stop:1438 length:435 start_codon:yes stop_codon:yes gene_type:complete